MKYFDLYGDTVKFNIAGKETVKSKFGGSLTILTIIVMAVFAWLIGNDIIYRRFPFSYTETILSDTYYNNTINNHNFPFAVSISDANNLPIYNKSLVTIKMQTITVHNNNSSSNSSSNNSNSNDESATIVYNDFELYPCKYSDFPLLDKQSFDAAGLNSNYCLQNVSFDLVGFWGDDIVKYAELQVHMCDFTDESLQCKSEQEIKEYLAETQANFNINFVNAAINLKNYDNPIQTYISNKYKYFDTDKNKIFEMNLQVQSITTDNGFLMSDETEIKFTQLFEMQTDSLNFDSKVNQLMTFVFYSSNKSDKHYRKYIKITDILASLGGLLKLISLVCVTLCVFYCEVVKNEYLLNVIFKFYSPDDIFYHNNNNNNIITKNSRFKCNNNDVFSSRNQINVSVFNSKTNVNSVTKQQQQYQQPKPFKISTKSKHCTDNCTVSYNNNRSKSTNSTNKKNDDNCSKFRFVFYERVKVIFSGLTCCYQQFKQNTKFKIYDKATTSLQKYFDVVYYIKQFKELEALRESVLTEESKKKFLVLYSQAVSLHLDNQSESRLRTTHSKVFKHV